MLSFHAAPQATVFSHSEPGWEEVEAASKYDRVADRRLDALVRVFSSTRRWRLEFPHELEDLFERTTSGQRARRMWREGLLAILVWAACLTGDLFVVRDRAWQLAVSMIAATWPVALLANELVRRNVSKQVREGSVAVAIATMAAVCAGTLGQLGAVGYAYAQFTNVVCASFAVLVTRIRFAYSMFVIGCVAVLITLLLWCSDGVELSVRLFGFSIAFLSCGILAAVAYWLEHEERLVFLYQAREQRRNEQLLEINAQLTESSQTDFLTGLPNRRVLIERLQASWSAIGQCSVMLSVVMIDVDHFKRTNDTHGHAYGDRVLARVAMLLRASLRQATDVAVRYGGEEFVILLPRTDVHEAFAVAERIRSVVEQAGSPPHETSCYSEMTRLTVSCGVACCVPSARNTGEQLLEAADRALYVAKERGRNQVAIAS